MKKLNVALCTVLIAVTIVGVYIVTKKTAAPQSEKSLISTPKGNPVFEWSYTFSSRSDVPEVTIHLTATYSDGTATTTKIEKIEGNCNEYAKGDTDVYPQSQMIICYYAGLGRYYKIVDDNGTYAVKRKIFEEASPDYNPPVQSFETIATF